MGAARVFFGAPDYAGAHVVAASQRGMWELANAICWRCVARLCVHVSKSWEAALSQDSCWMSRRHDAWTDNTSFTHWTLHNPAHRKCRPIRPGTTNPAHPVLLLTARV